MDVPSLLEVWVSAGDTIDDLWSMYIVVHLGLFWFFFLVHRPLLISERLLAIFAYLCFISINGNALIGSYAFIEALRSDLTTRFVREFAQAPATLKVLNGVSYDGREAMIAITHLGGFAMVLVLFVMRNIMIRRYFAAYPDQGKTPGNPLD
jgi:hypothetical protein